MQKVRLKNNEDKRIRAGHLWVFSNEIDTAFCSLQNYQIGEQVIIESSQGKALGLGFINPNNLLCVRILSRDISRPLDKSFFVHRFNIARSLRDRTFDKPFYRLVHGEGDWLPGLVIDRFGQHFVVQLASAGMDQLESAIVEALVKVFKPESILLRNDSSGRKAEGLEDGVTQAYGETPERLVIEENDTAFQIAPFTGQKTGWFYDHRQSRRQICHYVQGKRVLDVCSYIGAFGIQALTHGASEAYCVDISEKALDQLEQNALINKVDAALTCVQGDAVTVLSELKKQDERFDVVIVDPPAFIKRKKDYRAGLKGYQKLNQAAMRLLSKDGILLSASCSMHLAEQDLQEVIRSAGRHLDKQVQIIEQCHQAVDHPINPAIKETRYIKGFIARVLAAS